MTAGQIWLAMASVYLWLARQRDGEQTLIQPE